MRLPTSIPSTRTWRLLAASVLLTGATACGGTEEEEVFDFEPDDMDLFASSGKTDTGYVSDAAAELEAQITGKVYVSWASLSASEQTTLKAALTAGNKAAFNLFPTEQIKYARNVLKGEKLNANMESAPADITKLTADSTKGAWVEYAVKVETLVKNKDLPAGTTIQSLVGKTLNIKVPADPKTALTAGGVKCATDPDDAAATDAATQAEISAYNYFYYWNPERSDCPLRATGLSTLTYKVANPAAAVTSYPEFGQLLSDKKITMVALFGQLEHGDLLSGQNGEWDWGWIGYEEHIDWLADNGFKRVSVLPDTTAAKNDTIQQKSSKWSKKFNTGMTVEVDVISPLDLQDHADKTMKDTILRDAVKNHEVVYYNGHSFYGSLEVLNDKANFPTYYQLVYMDSCWSYAYYTKQVFTSKSTTADPTGMLTADVLNNTEPAISGSHETWQIFLKKFFTAATFVAAKQPAKAKNYTWKNLVKYMNTSAKQRAERAAREGDAHDPEVYGVSGVSVNKWKP